MYTDRYGFNFLVSSLLYTDQKKPSYFQSLYLLNKYSIAIYYYCFKFEFLAVAYTWSNKNPPNT